MVKNSKNRMNWIVFSVILAATAIAGCSGSSVERPDVVPVTGVVMYNNKPVEGAMVSFMTEKAPRAATGITNEKGEFSLTTFEPNDGAVPGPHKITVSKRETGAAAGSATSTDEMMKDPTAMTGDYMKQMGNDGKTPEGPKSLVPSTYESPNTSPLTEEVKAEGENHFVLQLSD